MNSLGIREVMKKQKPILTYNTSKKKIPWLDCFICNSSEKEESDFIDYVDYKFFKHWHFKIQIYLKFGF